MQYCTISIPTVVGMSEMVYRSTHVPTRRDRQAAAVLGNERVDMVITDVRLTDGDGIEILRHVKARDPEKARQAMCKHVRYSQKQAQAAGKAIGQGEK